MPWIERDETGKIVGVNSIRQEADTEELPDDNIEVIDYRTPALSKLEKLEALISQGQLAMEELPLPLDLQKEIFDLEVFINNYYRRGAVLLIKAAIESFVIPPERTDVTGGQRAQVEGLKAEMLAVFA